MKQKRIREDEDVLQRRPVRYRWPKRRPQLILEGFTPDGVKEMIEMLMGEKQNDSRNLHH